MKFDSLSILTPKTIHSSNNYRKTINSYSTLSQTKTPIAPITLFQTQIHSSTSIPSKQLLGFSRNKKQSPYFLYKKQLKAIRSSIDDSFTQITHQNKILKTLINCNPYVSFSFKDYLQNTKAIDMTTRTIKTEIQTLGKEIDQKGLFVTISNKNSNSNDAKSFTKIFVSEKKDNIYNKIKQADLLNPESVLRFRKRFEKEYNIDQKKLKTIRVDTTLKFLQAYNKEVQFKKRIEEMYNIKANKLAHYITSL